jgi:hypothetical protein
MRRSARDSIDALHLQPKQIDGLNALVDDHGYRRAVASEQILKRKTEHGVDWWLRIVVQNATALLRGCLPCWTSWIVGLGVRVRGCWGISGVIVRWSLHLWHLLWWRSVTIIASLGCGLRVSRERRLRIRLWQGECRRWLALHLHGGATGSTGSRWRCWMRLGKSLRRVLDIM